jgi:hypothetical protein
MSSVTTKSFKQTNALYVPLGDCANKVLQFAPGAGAGGSYAVPAPTAAAWASNGSAPSKYTSTISTIGAGGYFRDMGKTIVSASRTFRKVQLLVNTVSTSGVGGPLTATGAANVDFLTGYIEVANGPAFNGNNGTPAPVAVYPSMW